ncbi:HU family DNA-binding protein [Demequina litorisediminis]|uniref:DNA-binding protein HU n=1 Tax=Demequina litorisediminis TaxID=1849022 RepID=A0ABQ6I976_9MICO|nr:HU family DNA-binding protein [Demequina litorisediminis]GMA34174.1 DNA-binding protein HU [Demequina litorisediminis]
MTLQRTDIAQRAAAHAGVDTATAEAVLKGVEAALVEAAGVGESVRLTGTLSLEVVERPARTGRNPRTGEAMEIAAGRIVRLSPGAGLKRAAKGDSPRHS